MIPNRFAAQVAGPNNPDAETSRQNPQRDIPRRLRTTDMPRGTARNPRTLKSDFSDIQCRLFLASPQNGDAKNSEALAEGSLAFLASRKEDSPEFF